MKCSVLLPVYNGREYLPAAIESILGQDENDFEFLIIDDCSSDGSADVIRRYASADARVRALFHPRNMGLSATLNEGLRESRADLVVRMDQDDMALPQRISTQVRFMREHPNVAVAGSFAYHMGREPRYDRLVQLPVEHDEIVRTLLVRNCIYHPSVILRRDSILALGGYRAEFKNSEDYDLWLRAGKAYRLANIPAPLLRYRFTTGGMSLSRRWQQVVCAQTAVVSFRHPDWSYAQAEREAAAELEKQGRGWVLEQAARGTVRELNSLRLHREALRMLWVFARQLNAARAARMTLEFGFELLRASLTPAPH
ncbi:MAG TPA: glycosyltransferase [Bryobacteraceae bacterium]|nr:glycosyltransferase [Bryobacteraceae bacterium]